MARTIPVYVGDEVVAHTTVDDEYADQGQYRWTLTTKGYVQRSQGRDAIRLHRVVLGLTPGDRLQGDHINGDKLDNRRANLRVATNKQNAQNRAQIGNARNRHGGQPTSGSRGVCWEQKSAKWRAYVMVDGKQNHVGYFEDESEAVQAATDARRSLMPFDTGRTT